MSHMAAAHVELPVMLSAIGSSSKNKGKGKERAKEEEVDLENMTSPDVVGREAGERDPLSLRKRMMSDDAIEGLRQ
jgi:hypothetical protein